MAVIAVKLKFAGISGKDHLIINQRDYTSIYLVETDNPNDGPDIVKRADGIPRYGSFWKTDTEQDSSAYLLEREAVPIGNESSQVWLVTCQFSSNLGLAAQQIELIAQPFGGPPTVEWDFHEDKETAWFAYDTKNRQVPIINSTGDFYDPAPERDFARLILRVTQNYADYDPIRACEYANTLNSDNWYGFPPWTVLCKPFKASWVVQSGVSFWSVRFEFHFDFRLWLLRLWDAGLREFNSEADIKNRFKSKGKKAGYTHLKNEDGTFVTDPQLLDGNGHRLVGPHEILAQAEGKPVINTFRLYRQMPFGPLNVLN